MGAYVEGVDVFEHPTRWITPTVEALLREFLQEALVVGENEAVKEKWCKRADLAKAMTPYVEAVPIGGLKVSDHDSDWMDEAAAIFPKALFWQFSLFRTCARRAIRKQESDQMTGLADLPGFGVF